MLRTFQMTLVFSLRLFFEYPQHMFQYTLLTKGLNWIGSQLLVTLVTAVAMTIRIEALKLFFPFFAGRTCIFRVESCLLHLEY